MALKPVIHPFSCDAPLLRHTYTIPPGQASASKPAHMHPATSLSCPAQTGWTLRWAFSPREVADWLAGRIHEMSRREADAILWTEGFSSVKQLPCPRGRLELLAPWNVALTVVKGTPWMMALLH